MRVILSIITTLSLARVVNDNIAIIPSDTVSYEYEKVLDEIVAYRKRAEALPLPKDVADKVADELKRLEKLPTTTPESGVIRDYLDALLKLPWGKVDEENFDIKHAEEDQRDIPCQWCRC